MKIPGLGNIGDMMKNMQKMQEKMQSDEEALNAMEIHGEAGAGVVKVTLNGRKECLKVSIDDAILSEEKTFIEDLVAAAFNAAGREVDKIRAEKIGELTGGMKIPGGLGALTSLLK